MPFTAVMLLCAVAAPCLAHVAAFGTPQLCCAVRQSLALIALLDPFSHVFDLRASSPSSDATHLATQKDLCGCFRQKRCHDNVMYVTLWGALPVLRAAVAGARRAPTLAEHYRTRRWYAPLRVASRALGRPCAQRPRPPLFPARLYGTHKSIVHLCCCPASETS